MWNVVRHQKPSLCWGVILLFLVCLVLLFWKDVEFYKMLLLNLLNWSLFLLWYIMVINWCVLKHPCSPHDHGVVVWEGMASIDSRLWMCNPYKGVALLECVTLLEEVCHCGGRLWRLLCAQTMPCVTQSPSAACRSRYRTLSSFSSTMSACMPPCPAMKIMD